MRKEAALALLFLAACGGNYSNGDVEFIAALPVRSELESKLPQVRSSYFEYLKIQTGSKHGIQAAAASKS